MTKTQPREFKKLTDWEIGQELVAISDYMGEHSADFKDSHPELYALVLEARRIIGDYFNRHHLESHGFGIPSHDELPEGRCCQFGNFGDGHTCAKQNAVEPQIGNNSEASNPCRSGSSSELEEMADLEIKRLAKELNIGRVETEVVWNAATARAEGEIAELNERVRHEAMMSTNRALDNVHLQSELAELKAKLVATQEKNDLLLHEMADLKEESLATSDVGNFPEKELQVEAIKLIGVQAKFSQDGEPIDPITAPNVGWSYNPQDLKLFRKGATWMFNRTKINNSPPISSLPADEIAQHPLVRGLIAAADNALKTKVRTSDWTASWEEPLKQALAPFRKKE